MDIDCQALQGLLGVGCHERNVALRAVGIASIATETDHRPGGAVDGQRKDADQLTQPFGERGVRRLQRQMDVVGHEAVGMKPA